MKSFPLFLVAMALVGCADLGTPSAGIGRPDGLRPGEKPFENSAKSGNKYVTNMIITNDTQATDVVAYLLRGYNGEKNRDNYPDIAKLAIQIASGDTSGIDSELLNPALYIIDSGLYSSCSGAADISNCITTWRADNTDLANRRVAYLREWADSINISDAVFESVADTQLKFTVNSSGDIDSIIIDDVEYERDGTTNKFSNQNGTVTYISGAKDDLKLSYSDFGMYQIKSGNNTNKIAFAGGYTTHEIPNIASVVTYKTFTGDAVGNVYNGTDSMALENGTATLTFDKRESDVKTTLTANFANWYGFTVNQIGNGAPSITFTDDKIDTKFNPSGTGDVAMNVKYYGPTATNPTEAVGTVQYTESDGIGMDVAFGVK